MIALYNKHRRPILLVLLGLVLLGGLYSRVYRLDADPPTDFGDRGQDLNTDPAHLTSFAATYAKFGVSEPFPIPKWQVFKVTLVSGVAYGLFSLASPSLTLSNLAGVIPSFLGLVLIVIGIAFYRDPDRSRSYRLGIIAGIFLLLNFVMITYNRAPFMESGLTFYFGLILFFYFRYGLQMANVVSMAILVSLACLTGKMFGLGLGLAILGVILTGDERPVFKGSIFVLCGIVSAGLLAIVFFGDRLPDFFSYIREQAYSSHGSELIIFADIGRFFAHPLLYGTQQRMFTAAPCLFFATYLGVIFVIANLIRNRDFLKKNAILHIGVFLLLGMAILLIPTNYRPMRYSTLMYIPMALVAATAWITTSEDERCLPRAALYPLIAMLFFINWFFLFHTVHDFFFIEYYKSVFKIIIWSTLGPALAVTWLMLMPRFSRIIRSSGQFIGYGVTLLAVVSVFYQGSQFIQWSTHTTSGMKDAGRDVAEVLGPDAVLTGPYAPLLTLDNNLRSVIYSFGLEKPDFNIFTEFPITHLAVDRSNMEAAVKDYIEAKRAVNVTNFVIRDKDVLIFRVAGLTDNAQSARYLPTEYERAVTYDVNGYPDSALAHNDRFLKIHPENRSGLLQRCLLLAKLHRPEEAMAVAKRVQKIYFNDAAVKYFCEVYLQKYGVNIK